MEHKELSEEKISNIKELFSLYDKDGDGVIDIEYIQLIICALNMHPNRKELEKIKTELDPGASGYVDFPTFLAYLADNLKDDYSEEELLIAFKTLDSSTFPLIRPEQLKYQLTTQGDKFTEEEAKEMIQEGLAITGSVGGEDKSINVVEFARHIIYKYRD